MGRATPDYHYAARTLLLNDEINTARWSVVEELDNVVCTLHSKRWHIGMVDQFMSIADQGSLLAVSYTHLTLPTKRIV